MFAVIKTGGKQYKVAKDDIIKIEKLEAQAGQDVLFDNVLMVGSGADVSIGEPLVNGASVVAELIETKKQKTIIIFKKKRRQGYRRRNGHRQLLSTVRIVEILTDGKKASPKKVAAKKPAKAKAAPAKAATKKASADFIDDIKLISGVGPALEKKLHAAGVKSLKDIAAFKKADIERVDSELKFGGRIEREEWIEQAKELIAGKAPRAKIDQKAAIASKDKK
ncbi:MAG: 50S ribosomal protein L21 [Devosiaceae bacterium]|nr:50S ribosomal protein L21 [Devosiaceae bacterium]